MTDLSEIPTPELARELGKRNARTNISQAEARLYRAPDKIIIGWVDLCISNAMRIYGPTYGDELMDCWKEGFMDVITPWLVKRKPPRKRGK